jgi:hypothetical protein
MKKMLGVILVIGAIISLAIFFFAPSIGGERESLARMADGDFFARNPRSVYFIAGVAMGLAGSALLKKS